MPGILQLVQVSKNPARIQSLLVQNDPFMLVNPDITNNIFIGNDQSLQVIAVPPLGSVTLDPKTHDVWVSTNGGAYTVSAYLMPNGTNWVPSPAQVAAQINALGLAKDTTLQTTNSNTSTTASNVNTVNTTLGTPTQRADVQNLTVGGNPGGIPVLRGTINLGTATAQTLAGGGIATLISLAAITKPSFEAIFQLNLPVGVGTLPFAQLALNWTDSNTGLTVGFKQYILAAGNGPSNVLTIYLSGPCRGNQLTVTLTNFDPAQILTFTWAINQTSHIYTIDRLLQPAYAGIIGFTNSAGNPAKGILMASAPSIAPNSTVSRLIAASNAKCKINIDDSAQANAWAVDLSDPGSLYNMASGTQHLYKFNGNAGSNLTAEIQMPNGPLLVNMQNTAATNTITLGVTITVMEY